MAYGKKIVVLLSVIILILIILGTIYKAYNRSAIRTASISYVTSPIAANPSQCPLPLVTVLSIDGGGVKGIIPAFFLHKIEQTTQQPTANLFDFMTGVSTGTILISILTVPTEAGKAKYTAEFVLQLYKHKAAEVFSSSFIHRIITLGGLLGPKYQSYGMQQLAEEYFGDMEMSKLISNVTLFGYDLKNKGLIAFTNMKERETNMPYYKVKDVIEGTTAIMSYFKSKSLYNQQNKRRHIVVDASLVLNNPAAMAFLYAYERCPDAANYLVVSFGTGQNPTIDIEPNEWGLIHWLPDMFVTTIEGETITANIMTEKYADIINAGSPNQKAPKVMYVRINPLVPWDQSDPVDASASHLDALEKIAKDYYQKNGLLFTCLNQVLMKHSVDAYSEECLSLINQSTIRKSPIYFDLETSR